MEAVSNGYDPGMTEAYSPERARELLRSAFGHPAFRGAQEEIVAAVCAGRDALVLMSAPLFGLITAAADGPGSRIRTGQLFERLYLTAERYGLALQPISQIVEDPTARARLAELVPGGVPMQPFRVGYAEPVKEHTPRRPIEDVLI